MTLIEKARALRRQMTHAEVLFWQQLRGCQVEGVKFRRQHPVPPYIADFASLSPKLIIELDGGHHADQRQTDARRSAALEAQGFTVLRFWNNAVLDDLDAVVTVIKQTLRSLKQPSQD